jgi:hypothetical protein
MIYHDLQGKVTAVSMANSMEDKFKEILGVIKDLAKIVEDQDKRIKALEKK